MDWEFFILIFALVTTWFVVGFSVGQDVTRAQIAREEARKAEERLNKTLKLEEEKLKYYKSMYGK